MSFVFRTNTHTSTCTRNLVRSSTNKLAKRVQGCNRQRKLRKRRQDAIAGKLGLEAHAKERLHRNKHNERQRVARAAAHEKRKHLAHPLLLVWAVENRADLTHFRGWRRCSALAHKWNALPIVSFAGKIFPPTPSGIPGTSEQIHASQSSSKTCGANGVRALRSAHRHLGSALVFLLFRG